ncbi:glutaredoxin family protein [Aliiglaciecola sp. CAU 1673]|uniref:glutaredoxin family protein n=1 Tax=Aliiglaciecola sp. CAU 1673 TaxID=3032595 RepID=UPI0023DB44A5|nr:glutaredoxin family protein [Aliiglaciecola sp. CAU 1673]MDF2177523.1 glutaredoxin family protein [Aliiglaciecola sp. CAU 1673]
MNEALTLYGTLGCHLCEDALALVKACAPTHTIIELDIVDDESLYAKYRTSIPVLRDEKGRELNWPFNETQLKEFLS